MKDLNVPSMEGTEFEIFTTTESEARSYCRNFDRMFDRAKGSEIFDLDNKPYIDFLAGCSSLNYGHNEDDLKAALIEYISRDGMTHTLDMYSEAKRQFLDTFDSHILQPRGLDYRVQFTGPTGTNAVEAAMKLARKVTGRRTIISFTNGFHGVSGGSLQATGARYHRMGQAAPGDVARAPFDGYFGPDVDTSDMLQTYLDDPSSGFDLPAAIILEPIQGEGGLNAASAQWLRNIARIAKRFGALLIVDDIQSGCGRSGDFFGFEEAGIVPDMVTMAKSLSGYGLPMAAVLIKPEHDQWKPAEHNGTFRGNAHAFVTARAAITKFWSDSAFTKDIKRRAGLVEVGLTRIAAQVPDAKLVGRGMMRGVNVVSGETAGKICRRAFEMGLIIETSGNRDQVVKVLAPLTTPDDLLTAGLETLLTATKDVVGNSAV